MLLRTAVCAPPGAHNQEMGGLWAATQIPAVMDTYLCASDAAVLAAIHQLALPLPHWTARPVLGRSQGANGRRHTGTPHTPAAAC